MEKITGMKITRQRPGKVMQKLPRELVFYNSEGEIVLRLRTGLGAVEIHHYGAEVVLYGNKNWPLFRGKRGGGMWVTTNSQPGGERVFPVEE